MIHIHTLLVGQPQQIEDAEGVWRSAIYRQPVAVPIALGATGLEGDAVADTKHHGSPDQAVCCHPIAHYAYWRKVYGLTETDPRLQPGGVGENWTLDGATEDEICIGDIFHVGTARVQVSQPRYPCWKQERRVSLPDFLNQTLETMRTGFYVRVLTPGIVRAGDSLTLEARPHPQVTVQTVNASLRGIMDEDFVLRVIATPELSPFWREILASQMAQAPDQGARTGTV